MFVLKFYFATIISVAQQLNQSEGSGAGSASGSRILPKNVSAQKDFTTIPILIPAFLSHQKLRFTFLI